jgi:hypothetical protein
MSESEAGELFGWSGGEIVLIGERSRDAWVLSRGWRQGDRLTGVRRWEFRETRTFLGQVLRLAREATGDEAEAIAAANDARAWVATHGGLG